MKEGYKMKKLLVVLSIVLVLGLLWNIESTYTRTAVVIDCTNDVIVCKDKSGNIWQYEGQAVTGETVVLIMNDNHTSTITDDIVKGIK